MANKTVLQIEGRFDPSQILSSLERIRKEMSKSGAKDSLFTGIDKELTNAQKLLTNLQASMSQGVSNSKDIDKITKEFDNLCKSLAKASTGMKNISNDSKNFNVNGAEISKIQRTLDQATEAKKKLEEGAKAALKTQMQSLKLNEGQQKAILKEINDQAKLEEAIKKVGRAKEQTYNQKYQQYISSNSSAQGKVAEINTREGGNLYATGLTEAVKNGETLIQTYERIKKLHADNNVQIQDEHALLTQLRQDYKSIIDAAYNTTVGQPKGQITQHIYGHQALGSTDSNGNFNLNQTGNNIVNAVDYAGLAQQTQQLATAQAELNRLTTQAAQDNQQYANTATQALDQVEEEQRQVAEGFHNTAEAQRESMNAQEELNKTFDSLKDTVKRILSLSSAFSGFKRVITETFKDVQKLDSAFKSIALVTNKSVSELWSSYGDYAEMANKLGQSTENAIKSSALFYQQGLDTAEALTLTEDTMKLATLSGQGFEEATRQMTAALRGFHMEMEQGSHITDVYSELAANAAADVHGIAYAMSKTASIASSAGMSFENTAAFLTNMIETTQEAPENIGTAMKTIIARFTELKENVSQADSEFDDLDYNKVDKALKSIGMNMKDTNGQFRNLDEIFLELSSKWSTLDRNTQRYIATTAAGSRQQSRFIAMMEDYGRTMELVETAQNSAGKSEEQFAKYADTLEYKVNALKNTWEQLRMSILNADIFKSLIDGANGLLGKISKLDFKKALLTALPMTFIIKNFITKFISGVKQSANNFATVGKLIATKMSQGIDNKTGIFSKIFKKDQQELDKLKANIELVNRIIEHSDPNGATYQKAQQKLKSLEQEYNATTQKITQNTIAVTNGLITIGQSAAMALSMVFAGGEVEDALKMMTSSLLAQGLQFGIQWASQWAINALAPSASMATGMAGAAVTTAVEGQAVVAAAGTVGTEAGVALSAGFAATGVGALVVLIGAAVAGIAALIVHGVKEWKAANKTLDQQYEIQKKITEEIKKQSQEAEDAAKSSRKEYQDLKKLQTEYEKYSNMRGRTAQEEEAYAEVVKQIQEYYPSIVTYYDETTGQLQIQKSLWDQILNDAKELAKEDTVKSAILSQQEISSNKKAENLDFSRREERLDNIFKEYDDNSVYEKINGIYLDEYAKKRAKDLHAEENYEYFREQTKQIFRKAGIEISKESLDLIIEEVKKTDDDNRLRNLPIDEMFNIFNREKDSIEEHREGIKRQRELSKKKYEDQSFATLATSIGQYGDYSTSVSTLLAASVEDVPNEGRNLAIDSYTKADEFDNKFLKQLGYTKKQAEQAIKDGKLTIDFLKEEYKVYRDTIDQFNKVDEIDISAPEQAYADKIIGTFNDLTLRELENSTFSSGFSNDELKTGAENLLTKTIEELEENKKKVIDAYGLKEGDLKDFTINSISAFENVMSQIADKLNPAIAKVLGGETLAIKEKLHLSMSDYTQIMTANWDEVDLTNIEQFKENLLNKLEASNSDKEKIWKTYSEIFEQTGVLNFTSLNVDSLIDKINDQMTKKIESTGKISKVIEKQFEDGFISFTDTQALDAELKEFGIKIEDYLKYYENGIVLDTEKLQNALFGEEDVVRKIVQQTIKKNEEKIQELQFELEIYKTGNGEITNNDIILKQKYEQLQLTLDILKAEGKITDYTLDESSYKLNYADDAAQQSLITLTEERIEGYRKYNEQLRWDVQAQRELVKEQYKINLAQKEGSKIFSDAAEKAQKDSEKAADALNKVAEAEDKVAEATKKLNEILYGTDYHKDALDLLYNYTINLERLEKKAKDAKDALEDLGKTDNANDLVGTYLSNTHDSIVNRKAQNVVLEQSIANRKEVLDNKLNKAIAEINANGNRNLSLDTSDYYTIVGDRLNVNHAAIDAAALPDDLKDYIHEQIQTINEEYDKMEENMDAIKDKEKELRDFQKSARDNYIKLEQKVIDTLKEKYEEEIKNNEDKNKALEEADNAYLDALKKNIDKQRKLREEANAWDDLAEKQKKLSLMKRDTSGANAKEVKKLQEDVEKTQQDLLDKSVDKIIEELNELYKTQKETRELEIEYQKAVIDNAKLIKEANDLINSWNGPEDMYEFMMNNTKNLSEMSQAQIEAEKEEWSDLFNAKEVYMATTAADFKGTLETQESEITKTVKETSEELTKEADRSLKEIKTKIEEAIESAEKALADAIKGLEDAKTAYENEQKKDVDLGHSKDPAPDIGKAQDDQYRKLKFDASTNYYSSYEEFAKKYTGISESIVKSAWRNSLIDGIKTGQIKTLDKNRYNDLIQILKDEGKSFEELLGFKILLNRYNDSAYGIKKYASGGLVDYTGPAWVDGTPNKPEAFLSPEDTQNIGMAAKLLASLPIFNYGSANNAVSSNIGDTSIEIHINVDSLGSDYDVDQLVERVKNDIADIARPTGTPVILNKR